MGNKYIDYLEKMAGLSQVMPNVGETVTTGVRAALSRQGAHTRQVMDMPSALAKNASFGSAAGSLFDAAVRVGKGTGTMLHRFGGNLTGSRVQQHVINSLGKVAPRQSRILNPGGGVTDKYQRAIGRAGDEAKLRTMERHGASPDDINVAKGLMNERTATRALTGLGLGALAYQKHKSNQTPEYGYGPTY